MSILGNINKLVNDEDKNNGYTTPAVIRDDKNYISFKKAFGISLLLHPLAVGLIVLISFVLLLLGINLFKSERPKPKMNDIEFVLVDQSGTPRNKNTKYRADRNSRGGGINDPKRKVSAPSPKPAKTQAPAKASAPAKKQVQKTPAPAKKSTTPAKSAQTKPTQKTATPAVKPTNPKPAAPSLKPSTKPVAVPNITSTPKTSIQVPAPKNASTGAYSTGPVGGSGSAKTHAGGSYSPSPSLAPTYNGSGSSSGTKSGSSYGTGSSGSSASRGGTGGAGNPSGGGGRPGIDAIASADFGPYMRDLQRRIKMNWDPPKGDESKRVILMFKIAKDGRLLSCSVYKSSGLPAADKAAMNAVYATAPFRPLPANFKGASVDIQFTFDYNVFGGSYR